MAAAARGCVVVVSVLEPRLALDPSVATGGATTSRRAPAASPVPANDVSVTPAGMFAVMRSIIVCHATSAASNVCRFDWSALICCFPIEDRLQRAELRLTS